MPTVLPPAVRFRLLLRCLVDAAEKVPGLSAGEIADALQNEASTLTTVQASPAVPNGASARRKFPLTPQVGDLNDFVARGGPFA